jgi:hypothetical protein
MRRHIVLATLAVLLAPIPAWAPNPVPEPDSLGLLLIGAVAAGLVSWRTRKKHKKQR